MGIVLGYLCLACMALLLLKFVFHRLHMRKADIALGKLHRPVGFAFIVLCVIHLIFVLPVLKTRAAAVTGTGIALFVLTVVMLMLHYKMKDRKKSSRLHLLLSAVALVLIAGHMITYFSDFSAYKAVVNSIKVQETDIGGIADGEYEGEYDAGYIYAKVRVAVKGGAISSIAILEHNNERGAGAEAIVDKMVDEQRIDVDAVSGATNSSKVIKMAVADALGK